MARVRAPWTPPSTDAAATAQCGVALQSNVDIDVSGVWWYQRIAGPATVRASLWDSTGPANLADSGNVGTAGFVVGAWNLIPVAVTLPAGGTYVAAVLVASAAAAGYDGNDLTEAAISVDGHVTFPAAGGRFNTGSGFVFPANVWSGMHAVDIEYTLAAPPSGDVVNRPFAGLIARPDGGIIARPFTGLISRPFAGAIDRP